MLPSKLMLLFLIETSSSVTFQKEKQTSQESYKSTLALPCKSITCTTSSNFHVTFKVNVIISHRNFFFYYLQKKQKKHLGKATNLHLHYHANPLLALQAQIFIIPIFLTGPQFFIFHPQI